VSAIAVSRHPQWAFPPEGVYRVHFAGEYGPYDTRPWSGDSRRKANESSGAAGLGVSPDFQRSSEFSVAAKFHFVIAVSMFEAIEVPTIGGNLSSPSSKPRKERATRREAAEPKDRYRLAWPRSAAEIRRRAGARGMDLWRIIDACDGDATK
jgi:hypothetical protein